MLLQPTTRSSVFILAVSPLLAQLLSNSADAQEWAKARLEQSPRHLEFVNVKQGNRELNCFVAHPEVAEKAHAIVVIHDISGLGDWIRGVSDQLAEAGYIAIVPDLLSGMGPKDGGTESFASIDDARRAIPKLPPDQITRDLNAVADYVRKLPSAKGTVSVAGFCWGGGQTLRYATNSDQVKAAFVFYGYEPVDAQAISRVACPVYGFYGENDARINATIPDVKKLMSEAKKTFEPLVYKGAGHGFMRQGEDPSGNDANKQAQKDAWVRWKSILKSY